MFDALRNMNDLMQKGAPTTMKEHSFQQTYSSDLKEAGRYVQAFESSGNVKDLNQAWEIYCSVSRIILKNPAKNHIFLGFQKAA